MASHSEHKRRSLPATAAGTFTLAPDLMVTRMGYGAMQLARPHLAVLPTDRVLVVTGIDILVDPALRQAVRADF